MIKKTITFTDFNDVERTEDFYFNLSKFELLEMSEFSNGDYAETIEKAINDKDYNKIMNIFKSFIFKSYGVKSEDGFSFEKSEELSKRFMQSEAYTELLMELSTDDKAAQEFIYGIVPKEYRAAIDKAQTQPNK